MATTEERVDRLEEKYTDLHTAVNVLVAKVDATNNKVDNLISEMRDRDNQRRAESEELRQSIQEIYQTTDAKIARIEAKVDSTNKYISNFFYTSLAAIGAMLLTVILNLPKG